ncbi:hypothetical protein Ancab_015330 [Ancistrocladus abbreviatus]
MGYLSLIFLTPLFVFFPPHFSAAASPKPHTLLLPFHKDKATHLLVTQIHGRTPLIPVSYVVDLKTEFLWVNCETNYTSSTLYLPKCGSPQCAAAKTKYCFSCPHPYVRPFCHNNTCGLLYENPVTHQSTIGEVSQDVLAIRSTDGSTPGPLVKIPNFLFTCSPWLLIEKGLPKGVQGVLGLAQAPIAIQNQLPSLSGLKIKPAFAFCIPSDNSNGPIFFGYGPYNFLPGIDASQMLKYTSLIISAYREYYIQVKSIKINQKLVPVNMSLLTLSSSATGGTTFSTTDPHTILEGSIFKAITSFFAKQLSAIPTVEPVAPFGLCYESKRFQPTRLGPGVPSIDLELQGHGVVWSIFGANSLVEAKPGVLCLAFVNGKSLYRAAITIGTYQLQDVLLQVDLTRSRVGFTGPLIGVRTNCGNFNFTASG